MLGDNIPIDQLHIDEDPGESDVDEFGNPIEGEEEDFTGASDELGFAPDR